MPVYGLMIGFHTFVFLHLANGPLWKKIIVQESDYCQQNWWSNLLFINNYVDADHPAREYNTAIFCNKNLIYFCILLSISVYHPIVVFSV